MNERSFIVNVNRFSGGIIGIGVKKINDKYNKILEAAVKVFAEQGFFKATISQIAKKAGVADGTIYLYFKNKDDILVQIFEVKTKQVFARFRKEVDRADDALNKLRNLIRIHLEEFQKNKDMAIVFLVETHQKTRKAEEQIKEMFRMYTDIVADIIEYGRKEGVIGKNIYLGLATRLIVGAVNEVINTWVHSDGKYDLVSTVDPLLELFIKGIGSEKRP